MGHSCIVAASSLVPQRPGDQVKNDRRDARKLARHLRNGDLTCVWVPDEDNETLRDLSRARQSAKEDLHRNRQKLLKFLLRLGVRPPQGIRNWGSKHWQWLKSLKLDNSIQQMILSEHIYAIEECDSRVTRDSSRRIKYHASTNTRIPG
ncbi:MAG: transposase [Bacillota bacterium]